MSYLSTRLHIVWSARDSPSLQAAVTQTPGQSKNPGVWVTAGEVRALVSPLFPLLTR
jgi:hypothetical protein